MFGAGVIGSVYAARLNQAGHEVILLARGSRLSELQTEGLILQEAISGDRLEMRLPTVSEASGGRYDLILVPVRAEQLIGTLGTLAALRDGGSDVLFFGNTAGHQGELMRTLGKRALFGFPAVGGVRDGPVIRYVLIDQQKTMLGEANGETTPRIERLRQVFDDAGFSAKVSAAIDAWLLAHAAFVVPIALSLYRVGIDPARLAADPPAMRLMVRATKQAFRALRSEGNMEIPTNLRILYGLPTVVAITYWRRLFASPRGELWFAGHARAAPEEMRSLAIELRATLPSDRRSSPDLNRLLATL